MKINGRKISEPNKEYIAIPRGNGEDIVFIAQAIIDGSEFEKLCPVPKPPLRKINGEDIPNLKDDNYLKKIDKYAKQRLAWMILTSLASTEGLEWEQVDLGDHSTWHLYEKELRDSGFSTTEIQRIINGVLNVNCLNEEKVEEARARFLLTLQKQQSELNSLPDALQTMQSGEPASD
jgi:hypothetical protein